MHNSIQDMLERYQPQTTVESIRALREIIQEIALVGLWRAKFFQKAAFYGGTALRILYGLDRFSEDLDFSLLEPDASFSLESYNLAIKEELSAFGFEVTVDTKIKNTKTTIESAFIKANTKIQLVNIGLGAFTNTGIASDAKVKIKLEVDIEPPPGFSTEAKILKEPIPISVRVYKPEDLFAGKMHALLCRSWKTRVKGRDWYDFAWFIRKEIPLNLQHLESRLRQSGHLGASDSLTQERLLEKVTQKIDSLDVGNTRSDIQSFVTDPAVLACWSQAYFKELISGIQFGV